MEKMHPTVKTIMSLGGLISYQENDPSTPDLNVVKNIPSLPNPCPPFSVLNFNGGDAPEGTIEHQAANVYCTIAFSLGFVQTKLEKPIIRWAAMTKLLANPRSGKMFNAYYDRYYLNFFYDDDPLTNQIVYTCDSTDVVAHELGHAILDALRPDLWGVQSVEMQAFHEAFGDINAILTAMTFPEMIKKALNETNNDLSKENTISKLAEQMGIAINHAQGTEAKALRNAVNSFQYVPPETLPPYAGDDLAGEPHSFSRVFVGAWYDSFVNIYNQEKITSTPEQALGVARDKIATITYNAVKYANKTSTFYTAVLEAMLAYDISNNFGCSQAIRDGFAKHNIITTQKLKTSMVEQDFQPITAEINLVNVEGFSMIANIDRCIVELANHPSAEFVKGKNEVEDALRAAHHALKVLYHHGRIGHGPSTGKVHDKEFSFIDGKVVRNFYCCHFHNKVV
jgi:hypothetical protein